MSSSSVYNKNELQKLCVHGFIRIYAISMMIPNELIQICLAYYLILMDDWNEELLCKGFEIKENKELSLIKSRAKGTLESWHTAVGSYVVSNGSKYEWNFKVHRDENVDKNIYSSENKVAILIGITPWPIHDELLKHLEEEYLTRDNKWGSHAYYAYDGDCEGTLGTIDGTYSKHGPVCKDQDTLKMTLDLTKEKGELSFVVTSAADSQTHSFVGVSKIDVNHDYVMGVSFCDPCESIQIIE